jgi:putative sigma-54 modulation protein
MVDITITGVHMHVSDKVKAYVQEKLGGLDRYHQGLSKMHVTIHHAEKHGFKVDLDMHLPHGKDIVAHDKEETLHAAVDVVADKAAAQLRKAHAREVEHRR